jgi:uncharacterized membrane protein YsdA (DUF1294 family)
MAFAFVIGLAAAVGAGKVPSQVLALYLGASVVAFFAYWLDKAAARRGRWRTQESTLQLFALVGGWPGALFAQRIFRHKSSKVEFQRVLWVTVVINLLALGWFLTPTGAGEAAMRFLGIR